MVIQLKGLKKGMVNGLNDIHLAAVAYTASGAIGDADTYATISKSGIAVMTLKKPDVGRLLVVRQIDGGTDGHTLTLAYGTFDGTNNTATFNAQFETLVLYGTAHDRYTIILNHGSVALSLV